VYKNGNTHAKRDKIPWNPSLCIIVIGLHNCVCLSGGSKLTNRRCVISTHWECITTYNGDGDVSIAVKTQIIQISVKKNVNWAFYVPEGFKTTEPSVDALVNIYIYLKVTSRQVPKVNKTCYQKPGSPSARAPLYFSSMSNFIHSSAPQIWPLKARASNTQNVFRFAYLLTL